MSARILFSLRNMDTGATLDLDAPVTATAAQLAATCGWTLPAGAQLTRWPEGGAVDPSRSLAEAGVREGEELRWTGPELNPTPAMSVEPVEEVVVWKRPLPPEPDEGPWVLPWARPTPPSVTEAPLTWDVVRRLDFQHPGMQRIGLALLVPLAFYILLLIVAIVRWFMAQGAPTDLQPLSWGVALLRWF